MIFFILFLFFVADAIYWPGTKWCGPGNLAANGDDLGSKFGLDACCRDHDHCANVIPPFQQKFGHFNFQLTPLHECGCEEKFFNCLKFEKNADADADAIGRFYFNHLERKCFDLAPKRICTKQTWYWRSCVEYGIEIQAKIRGIQRFSLNFFCFYCEIKWKRNQISIKAAIFLFKCIAWK